MNDSFHFPILFVNDFWHLKEYYIPINDSTKSLPLYLEFNPLSFWRFQMSAQFSESCRLQEANYGIDTEDIKVSGSGNEKESENGGGREIHMTIFLLFETRIRMCILLSLSRL